MGKKWVYWCGFQLLERARGGLILNVQQFSLKTLSYGVHLQQTYLLKKWRQTAESEWKTFSISINGLLMSCCCPKMPDNKFYIKFYNFDKLSEEKFAHLHTTSMDIIIRHPLSLDFKNTKLYVSIWNTSSYLKKKKKKVKFTEMTNWGLKLLLLICNPLVSSVSGDAPVWARGLLSSSMTYAWWIDQADKYIWASQTGTFSSLPELMQDRVIFFDRTNLAALILQHLPKPHLLSGLLFLQIRPSFP